jgi:hypothetical protein
MYLPLLGVCFVTMRDVDRSTADWKMTSQMLGQSMERNQICLYVCQSTKFIYSFRESTTGNSWDETR